MHIRAVVSKGYLQRLMIISAACLGIGLWFLYDGAIGYPAQRVRALEYERLQEAEQLDQWEALASERGWSTEPPGEPKTVYDSYLQFIIATFVLIPGLSSIVQLLRYRRRWIEIEDNEVRSSWGQRFEIQDVTRIDKRKWHSKGIAKVAYQKDGRRGRLVLDDWKYEADPTEEILARIESPEGDVAAVTSDSSSDQEEPLPPDAG